MVPPFDLDLPAFAAQVASHPRDALFDGGRPRYVLRTAMFEGTDLEALCATAVAIRTLVDRGGPGGRFVSSILAERSILLLFAQPSTRTRVSFAAAVRTLGGSTVGIEDLSTTSFAKGETVADAVEVWAGNVDGIVIRHSDPDFATAAVHALRHSPRSVPLISAGSGTLEHPTQALLDVLTLWEAWGGIRQRRIAVIGDIGRNRAARSLVTALSRFEEIHLDLVCPDAHRPEAALIASLEARGVTLDAHASVTALVEARGEDLDAVYVTRLQQEWDASGDPLGTDPRFVLDASLRPRLGANCLILHPLPRVNELPTAWDDHPGGSIWRQVANGRWARAALMATQWGEDAKLRALVDRCP